MKTLLVLFYSLFLTGPQNIYDFNIKTIDGKEVKLSQFKGKKILIINTASKCGFAKQFSELEQLNKQYGKKLVLIGFPEGNFDQELASNTEIKEYCKKNFGVTFLMSEKISVKGKGINPLFKYLTTANNSDFTGDIKWNFEKFLINEKGELVHRFRSKVTPLSPEITNNL